MRVVTAGRFVSAEWVICVVLGTALFAECASLGVSVVVNVVASLVPSIRSRVLTSDVATEGTTLPQDAAQPFQTHHEPKAT